MKAEAKIPSTWKLYEILGWAIKVGLGNKLDRFREECNDIITLKNFSSLEFIDVIGVDPTDIEYLTYLENEIKKMKANKENYEISPPPRTCKSLQNSLSQNTHSKTYQTDYAQVEVKDSIEIYEERMNEIELLFLEGKLEGKKLFLTNKGAKIGNSQNNDIVLDDTYTSDNHINIFVENKKLMIKDLGSQNGTFRMINHIMIQRGMIILLGGITEFVVSEINEKEHTKIMKLKVTQGPYKNQYYEIDEKTKKIGRTPEANICLKEDLLMSGFHCEIYYSGGNFYIKDLNSTNKTWQRLSGENLESQKQNIYINDIFKVGSNIFQIKYPKYYFAVYNSGMPEQTKKINSMDMEAISPLPQQMYFVKSQEKNGKALKNSCPLCFENEVEIALQCGHTLCMNCSRRIENRCPFCRKFTLEVRKLHK